MGDKKKDEDRPEDNRKELQEMARNHSLYYRNLSAGGAEAERDNDESGGAAAGPSSAASGSMEAGAPETARASPPVSELVRRFESEPAPEICLTADTPQPPDPADALNPDAKPKVPKPPPLTLRLPIYMTVPKIVHLATPPPTPTILMHYLRPPRPLSPPDITSSDDDDREAVRRRSRDLSDDSAVELDPPPRRHSQPRELTPPPPEELEHLQEGHLMLLKAAVVDISRRSSEGNETRPRVLRTPSVVLSDYCDGSAANVGLPTQEEIEWLRRANNGSIDSACSSCSTLSSRDEESEPPRPAEKDESDSDNEESEPEKK